MRISDWSSDVCSSDLTDFRSLTGAGAQARVDGAEWTVGSPASFQASGVNVNDIASRIPELQEQGITVVLARRGAVLRGAIGLQDQRRAAARSLIHALHRPGAAPATQNGRAHIPPRATTTAIVLRPV